MHCDYRAQKLKTMSDSKKQEKAEQPSVGQKMAAKFRKASNDMSEAERERNFRSAMSLIYGGNSPAHVRSGRS